MFYMQYDTERTGFISRKTYQIVTVNQRTGNSDADDLKIGFYMMDLDRDGLVTKDEYWGLVQIAGMEMDRNLIDMAHDFMDLNGDGFVDIDEFMSASAGEGGDMEWEENKEWEKDMEWEENKEWEKDMDFGHMM